MGDVINLPSKIGSNIETDAMHVPRWYEKITHIMGLSGETRTGRKLLGNGSREGRGMWLQCLWWTVASTRVKAPCTQLRNRTV